MCVYVWQYHPDPLIRVFDMRMLRQAPPLTLTIPGSPVAACFFQGGRDRGGDRGPSFVALTSEGSVQTMALQRGSLERDMSTLPEAMYCSLLGAPPPPPASDISGKRPQPDQVARLAAGSSLGTLSLNALLEEPSASGVQAVRVNPHSAPLLLPPLTAPRPGGSQQAPGSSSSAGDGGPSPGSAHLLSKTNKTSLETSRLLSSFHSTPALRKRPLRVAARQKVLPATLALASFQDGHFLGCIKHQDLLAQHHTSQQQQQQSGSPDKQAAAAVFPPNSMLCAKAKGVGYAVCDPRGGMGMASRPHPLHQRHAPRGGGGPPAQRVASPHLSPSVTLSLSVSPTEPGPCCRPPPGTPPKTSCGRAPALAPALALAAPRTCWQPAAGRRRVSTTRPAPTGR